jgi:hypothetical protein
MPRLSVYACGRIDEERTIMSRNALLRLVAIAWLLCVVIVQAGPVPMPMDTALDRAKAVFVGKLTTLTNDHQERRILWVDDLLSQ